MAKYKVGDKVRVKSLEELRNNYYIDSCDYIYETKEFFNGSIYFSSNMYHLCENEYTINKVKNNKYRFENVESFIFEDWKLEDVVETITPNSTPRNKYDREIIKGVYVDVYDVLRAFEVTDQALGHLIKKALAVGKRGHKTAGQDYKDILDSAQRAYDQYIQWNEVANG